MNVNENETQVNEQVDNTAYIDAIRDLRENSVNKELYNKLKDERDALIKSLVNGTNPAAAEVEQVRSLAECREDFIKPSESQCEYMEKLLALREAAIREGEPDPMVATGHFITPTAQNYQRAQEIADIYRECLDYAAGDDKVFINEIQRRLM